MRFQDHAKIRQIRSFLLFLFFLFFFAIFDKLKIRFRLFQLRNFNIS